MKVELIDDTSSLSERSDEFLVPGPTQRLREVTNAVVNPTLAMMRKRKADEDVEDLKKLKLLKDPKIKKNFGALSLETLRDRLKPIGLDIQDQFFTVDQITRETMVTRRFMSSKYGGNMQEMFPTPSKKFLEKHGMNDFLFQPTEYQPEAPQLPGAPGLWFNTEAGADFDYTLRTFVKIITTGGSKNGSKYQYQGQYQILAADPPSLTVQEWRTQSQRFHNTWAQAIVKMGWGAAVCARVVLRRQLNREPTHNEVAAIIKNGRYKNATAEEVKDAYFQGKERLGVWTMKCVGYDNNFQQELHDTFPTWIHPPPKPKKKVAEPRAPRNGGTRTKRRPTRAKHQNRSESESSESEPESDKVVEDISADSDDDAPNVKHLKRSDVIELSDDEEPIQRYRGNGTKSHPILL